MGKDELVLLEVKAPPVGVYFAVTVCEPAVSVGKVYVYVAVPEVPAVKAYRVVAVPPSTVK
jgi:hypothetical protein